MKKIKCRIGGIVMTVLSIVLTVGVETVFPACGPKDDGSWMTCHHAGQAVFGMGIALTVISIISLVAGSGKVGAGASLAAVPLAVVTALMPGVFIGLCMMTSMHCHTVMRPAVIVICVLIACAAAVNALLILKKAGKSK